jgi:hypothetical protein
MRPRPRERRHCAANHPVPSRCAAPSRRRAPTPVQGPFPSFSLASPGFGHTLLRSGLSHRRGTLPPASCGRDAVPLGQNVEHLALASKNPRGVFLLHAGPHVVLSVADPLDSVRPTNRIP